MFDIEQGWTHENTCIMSYTTPRLDWIFSHKTKSKSTGIQTVLLPSDLSAVSHSDHPTPFYNLQGQCVSSTLSSSKANLPSGLYIHASRKVLVKH